MIRVGDVEIDFSAPVSKDTLRQYRAQSGFVFQSHNLFPHKTVLQNVTEGPVVAQRKPRQDAEAEAVELLEKVGLADKKDQYPFQLSGGTAAAGGGDRPRAGTQTEGGAVRRADLGAGSRTGR